MSPHLEEGETDTEKVEAKAIEIEGTEEMIGTKSLWILKPLA